MSPSEFAEIRGALFRAYGFDAEERRLEDGAGFRTYALVRERGTVPTLLVHGGLAEASVWAQMAGKLEGTVVVVDRPGCGLSDSIDYRGVDCRQHAVDWLRGVLDALGAPKVNLVGNSMGGYFCIAFAAAYPERVAQLLLPGAPAGLDKPLPLPLRLMGTPLLGRLLARGVPDLETFRARVLPMLVAHPERLPDDVLRVGLAAQRLPGVALSSRTMVSRVSTLAGFRSELMLRSAIASSSVPTRFIWGTLDRFASPSSGHELVSRMQHAEIEVLPGVGHMPQLEAPEAVAAGVNRAISGRIRPELESR
ncbi:MAG: alpha/beta hydrolase [Polyangiaceae bacterium]|nr:alpha/beta hydrolase [Polyangiaceae bacterium]